MFQKYKSPCLGSTQGNSRGTSNLVQNELYENAKKGIFNSKKFEFGERIKSYSPILHFFDCETVYETKPTKKITFKFIICKKIFSAKIGRVTNLNRHLVQDHKNDKSLNEWFEKYNRFNSQSKSGTSVDENMLLLIKSFISSNNALIELKNKFFRKLMIKAKVKTPDYRTFVNKLLPEVMKQIHETILSKLKMAFSISQITDIWTNKQLKDFIAVAANIINDKFNKELLVIGFIRMKGRHCAENVKAGVESIVNTYEFDKSKISSNFYNTILRLLNFRFFNIL